MQKELRFKTNSFWSLIGFVPTIITSGILIFAPESYIPLYRRFKTALSNLPDNYRFDSDHLFFLGFCLIVLVFCVYNPIKIISGMIKQKAAMNGEQVELTFVDYRPVKITKDNKTETHIKLTFEYDDELLTITDPFLPVYQTEKFFENNDPTNFSITGHMHRDTIYINQNDIEYVINENHRG